MSGVVRVMPGASVSYDTSDSVLRPIAWTRGAMASEEVRENGKPM